jgi:hypothetical protein
VSRHAVKSERNAEIVTARLAGHTLQEIASKFSVTRERVRQIVKRAGARDEGMLAIDNNRRKRSLDTRMLPYLRLNKRCTVCGTVVMRGGKRLRTARIPTCSSRCYRRLTAHRSHYDPLHFYRQFASILRHLDKRPLVKVRAAYRYFGIPLTPDLLDGQSLDMVRAWQTRKRTWTNVYLAEELSPDA